MVPFNKVSFQQQRATGQAGGQAVWQMNELKEQLMNVRLLLTDNSAARETPGRYANELPKVVVVLICEKAEPLGCVSDARGTRSYAGEKKSLLLAWNY